MDTVRRSTSALAADIAFFRVADARVAAGATKRRKTFAWERILSNVHGMKTEGNLNPPIGGLALGRLDI
jgi:hypothetical protein